MPAGTTSTAWRPVHGGTRDQAALFLAAADFVQGEDSRDESEEYEKAMKRIKGDG